MEPYPLSRKDALLHHAHLHARLQPEEEGKHTEPLVLIFLNILFYCIANYYL